jgi:hypothetical protein
MTLRDLKTIQTPAGEAAVRENARQSGARLERSVGRKGPT